MRITNLKPIILLFTAVLVSAEIPNPRAPHALVPDHWTKPSATHLQSFLPWASRVIRGHQGSPRYKGKKLEVH